jgi:hypothetical protein
MNKVMQRLNDAKVARQTANHIFHDLIIPSEFQSLNKGGATKLFTPTFECRISHSNWINYVAFVGNTKPESPNRQYNTDESFVLFKYIRFIKKEDDYPEVTFYLYRGILGSDENGFSKSFNHVNSIVNADKKVCDLLPEFMLEKEEQLKMVKDYKKEEIRNAWFKDKHVATPGMLYRSCFYDNPEYQPAMEF